MPATFQPFIDLLTRRHPAIFIDNIVSISKGSQPPSPSSHEPHNPECSSTFEHLEFRNNRGSTLSLPPSPFFFITSFFIFILLSFRYGFMVFLLPFAIYVFIDFGWNRFFIKGRNFFFFDFGNIVVDYRYIRKSGFLSR